VFPQYADPTGSYYIEPLPLLLPYLGGVNSPPPLFMCPSARGKPNVWGDGDPNAVYGGSYYADGSKSYTFNSHLRGSNRFDWFNPGPRMKVSYISKPGNVMWSVDGTSQRVDAYYPYWVAGYRHGGTVTSDGDLKPNAEGFNAAFADGHAVWVPWMTWINWRLSGSPDQQPFAWR